MTVIGGGGWGTALAVTAARKGLPTLIWARAEDNPEAMERDRENPYFLPGVKFPDGLRVTGDLELACSTPCAAIVMAVPTHGIRSVAQSMRQWRRASSRIVSAAKGFEVPSGLRPSEVLMETLGAGPDEICVLTGPTHAEEVSREVPSAIVAASVNPRLALDVQSILFTTRFRVYTHSDPVGAECAASLKNVIAIACGIGDGLGFGDNTRAALITRGLSEMARLGTALGGQSATFMGLAGIGDLVVTCTSDLSRNRKLGIRIGQGEGLAQIEKGMLQVAEGVRASQAAAELGDRHGIALPIIQQVHAILHKGRSPGQALQELLSREARSE